MSRPVYVLGTGLSHNGSAVLLKDGEVCVGIEKERISRKKHDGGNDSLAVQYCLDSEGITLKDVQLVVQCANFELPDPAFYCGARLFSDPDGPPVVDIPHHLAHAYSAVGTMPFDECNVLVVDGCGSPLEQVRQLRPETDSLLHDDILRCTDMQCEKDSFYHFDGQTLTPLFKDFSVMASPEDKNSGIDTTKHSIGGFYAAISQYVFGGLDDTGKLMGLAPFGEARLFDNKAFIFREDRLFLSPEWNVLLTHPASGYNEVKKHWQHYANIAKWAQEQVEWAVEMLFRKRLQQFPHENLCYSGGVALNAVANARLLDHRVVDKLYIEPAAGDNGLALGCAYYGWLEYLGMPRKKHSGSTCFGRIHPVGNIRSPENAQTTVFGEEEELLRHCASLLNSGKTIAWWQGGSEFGPRALGHRSILAHPGIPGMKEHINARIKFREDFRPFAPAVLEESAKKYFQSGRKSPYMILVDRTREEFREQLQNVTHADGSARTQTVSGHQNPRFANLLSAFEEESGIGVLLNTSLNRKGKPIVETPEEALQLFQQTALDVLVLENTVIEKMREPESSSFQLISSFLDTIGIRLEAADLPGECVLPGLAIEQDKILYDPERMLYPGDLLHEAGHLAITEPDLRPLIGTPEMDDSWPSDGDEIAAILWSYAAAKHLELPLDVVFHPHGYKRESEWIINELSSGNYIGLPLLEWAGLCDASEFPTMKKWLR